MATSTIDLADVQQHNKPDDPWILQNKVYDVSKYLEDLPRGDIVLPPARPEWAIKAFGKPALTLQPGKVANKVEAAQRVLEPKEWRLFKLVRKTLVLPNVYRLVFALPKSSEVLGIPTGQHVALRTTIDGKTVSRSYTPVSNNNDLGRIGLLIKVYEKGLMTKQLEGMAISSSIEMRGPKGSIRRDHDAEAGRLCRVATAALLLRPREHVNPPLRPRGKHHEVLVQHCSATGVPDVSLWCVGIAVDAIAGKLYRTQEGSGKSNTGRIFRASLDMPTGEMALNRYDIELVFDGLPEPIDLDLDLEKGLLYWADQGEHPRGSPLNRASVGAGNSNQGEQSKSPKIVARHFHEPIGLKFL
ncbi:hypothetical protein B0T25DRAFT_563754 [Lasiosphaeria hispida]|uniref:FAD-binding FR-type domain-containing protein n=1 Tax=Lasiosphaeria hispida TaxID=260671 RepID=A0AAJ0HP95_9PEZI|nr:hypothetical protein B0T25DRAFT_563754 [Lasiosphaeria hispida]